ncbi:MAG: hypothetical protein A2Y97_02050 [Nitrospirae bacterium RBG_13_39_12]|nr:MAG: hypothetical protein A2Y97_02050 [Nitrospirae bacterium RBG_13_39_12]
MNKNMGTADRILRTIVALVIVIILVTGKISGALAVIIGIVAAAFLLTSAIGWCPLYMPLKISTKKAEKK